MTTDVDVHMFHKSVMCDLAHATRHRFLWRMDLIKAHLHMGDDGLRGGSSPKAFWKYFADRAHFLFELRADQ